MTLATFPMYKDERINDENDNLKMKVLKVNICFHNFFQWNLQWYNEMFMQEIFYKMNKVHKKSIFKNPQTVIDKVIFWKY